MADHAEFDINNIPTLIAVSSADGVTPVTLEADPATHALIVQATISTAGLATAAGQTTGNASLASIDSKLPVLGQALAAASIPVVLTAAQLTTLTPVAAATSTVSTNNSSTAALLSGAVFTGTGEDVSTYSEMRINVFSNVASATDGLSVQQSSDNTNWDIVDTYTVAAAGAGQGKTYVVPRQAKFFRVVYTNGGTNQTTFRLQVILNRTGTAPSSQRPSDAYTNETDLVQNQVFLMGYNNTTWDRIRTKGTGVLSNDVTTINNVTPLMGNGVTGTGSQRVTVASDNTPFPVKIDQTTPGTTNLVALAANQSVNNAQIGGVAVSTGVGVTGTGVQRVVEANGAGRTLVSAGGSVASSGNNTLVAAGTNRLKVYGFSLTTTSTTAVTCIFQSGAGGTELWRVVLQAPTSVNVGANLIVTPPAWIFATASATLLNLNLSGAQTVHWSVAYYDEI